MEGGGEGALGTNPDEGEYLLCYFFVLSEVPAVNIIRKMWLPPVQDSLAILVLGLFFWLRSLFSHFQVFSSVHRGYQPYCLNQVCQPLSWYQSTPNVSSIFAFLPSQYSMNMSDWEGKFLQDTKSSYTRCSSSSVVRQSLVVPTSDGSVLVEEIFLHKLGSLGLRILPLAPVSLARGAATSRCKKKADVSKSLGVATRIWVKKVGHNFWGKCQELVRLTYFGLFCRTSGEYRKVKKGREETRKIIWERGRGENTFFSFSSL